MELFKAIINLSDTIMCDLLQTYTSWKVSVFGIFLVRISPHSDLIRRDTPFLSVLSRNAGKYRPEKLRIRTLFTQCQTLIYNLKLKTNFNRCYSLVVLVWIHLFIFLRKYGIKFRQVLKKDWNEKWKRASKIITNKKNRTAK